MPIIEFNLKYNTHTFLYRLKIRETVNGISFANIPDKTGLILIESWGREIGDKQYKLISSATFAYVDGVAHIDLSKLRLLPNNTIEMFTFDIDEDLLVQIDISERKLAQRKW